jgi:hypothetical protein
VAIKPKGAYTLTNSQKSIIENEIIKPISVITIKPKIVDVDYTYLVINSNILYSAKLTQFSSAQLQNQVYTAIQNFAASTLNTFNSTFQLSSLISAVQSVSPSFITNDANIVLQKRFTPALLNQTTYTFDYGVSLKKDIYSKSISVTPSFQYIDTKNNSIVRDAVYLEETPSPTTIIDSITIVNPGYGYTDTPTVTILGDGSGAIAVATIVNGQLNSIEVLNSGSGYTEAIVQISGGGGYLAAAAAVLGGNIGTIRSYYYDGGVKAILNPAAGTIDYENGIVTLVDFSPSQVNNPLGVLSIQAIPSSTIISSGRDKIITLDNTDTNAINVNITAK